MQGDREDSFPWRRPELWLKRLALAALGKRRWDEAVQQLVMSETREVVPWQTITADRELWNALELSCVDRVLRQT